MESFKGYCYTEDGKQIPPVEFDKVEDAVDFLKLQSKIYHHVVIVDMWDTVVAEMMDGKMIHQTKKPGKEMKDREILNLTVRADLLHLFDELAEETLMPRSEIMDEAIELVLRKYGKIGGE